MIDWCLTPTSKHIYNVYAKTIDTECGTKNVFKKFDILLLILSEEKTSVTVCKY